VAVAAAAQVKAQQEAALVASLRAELAAAREERGSAAAGSAAQLAAAKAAAAEASSRAEGAARRVLQLEAQVRTPRGGPHGAWVHVALGKGGPGFATCVGRVAAFDTGRGGSVWR
jgi:hypothetical protein